MDIEKLATSAVIKSISMTEVLSPFINDGDKEPSWDGNVYIYRDKKKSKDGIRRVPVQVKGKKIKCVPPKKSPKFSVSITDLDNWLNDGGIILFVVLIGESGTNTAIYYSSLLPVQIRCLKSHAQGKKSLSVQLEAFPSDNNKKVEILANFYNDMKKQTSFANVPLHTIEELEKEGSLESISVSIITYGKHCDWQDVALYLLQHKVCTYADVKGLPIPQPLPATHRMENIDMDIPEPIKIKGKIFYTKIHFAGCEEEQDLYIGKSMTIQTIPKKNKQVIKFKLSGNLRDYIRDSEFVIAFIENQKMTIGRRIYLADDFGDFDVEVIKRNLSYYKEVRKMLDLLGVKGDLNCENLTEQDRNNLYIFTNAVVHENEIGFPCNTNEAIYGRFRIANLVLLIWANKVSDKGYRLQSFFSDQKRAWFYHYDEKNGKMCYATQYLLLKKNDFIDAANIDYGKMVDTLSNDAFLIDAAQIYFLMQEMLNAYDEQDKKDEELFETAERYCEWLIENDKEETDIMTLNRLQVIRRKREFGSNEVQILQELGKENHDFPVRCGANILLGEMESAQECFDKMDDKDKDEFIESPICHFGKPNYKS